MDGQWIIMCSDGTQNDTYCVDAADAEQFAASWAADCLDDGVTYELVFVEDEG